MLLGPVCCKAGDAARPGMLQGRRARLGIRWRFTTHWWGPTAGGATDHAGPDDSGRVIPPAPDSRPAPSVTWGMIHQRLMPDSLRGLMPASLRGLMPDSLRGPTMPASLRGLMPATLRGLCARNCDNARFAPGAKA